MSSLFVCVTCERELNEEGIANALVFLSTVQHPVLFYIRNAFLHSCRNSTHGITVKGKGAQGWADRQELHISGAKYWLLQQATSPPISRSRTLLHTRVVINKHCRWVLPAGVVDNECLRVRPELTDR